MSLHADVLHKHPVPGTIVEEWIIPARGYAAFYMKKGQVLRFVDIEGKQVPVADTVRGFKEILDGKHDDVGEGNFYMKGGIEEIKQG